MFEQAGVRWPLNIRPCRTEYKYRSSTNESFLQSLPSFIYTFSNLRSSHAVIERDCLVEYPRMPPKLNAVLCTQGSLPGVRVSFLRYGVGLYAHWSGYVLQVFLTARADIAYRSKQCG